MRQPLVYFLFNPKTGLIKIGTSISFSMRLAELQRIHEVKLELLGVQHGGRHEEQALHQRFDAFRVAPGWKGGRREWFQDVPEIREYVQQHTQLNIATERTYVRSSHLSTVIRVSERTADTLDLLADKLQKETYRRLRHDEIVWEALKLYAPDLIKQIENGEFSESSAVKSI